HAYVAGRTNSAGFPTTASFQPVYGGGANDAFVVKLNAAGTGVIYSTYLGGSGDDQGWGIAVDAAGNAYLTGPTGCVNFPTANAIQPAFGGGALDAFVTKLDAAGGALAYSTYLGGDAGDRAWGIALDGDGNPTVAGETVSLNFPIVNAFQPSYGGG